MRENPKIAELSNKFFMIMAGLYTYKLNQNPKDIAKLLTLNKDIIKALAEINESIDEKLWKNNSLVKQTKENNKIYIQDLEIVNKELMLDYDLEINFIMAIVINNLINWLKIVIEGPVIINKDFSLN